MNGKSIDYEVNDSAEKNVVVNTAHDVVDVADIKPNLLSMLYSSSLEKKKRRDKEREKGNKHGKSGKIRKTKKEKHLELYDDSFENFNIINSNALNPALHVQNYMREGNKIHEKFKLNLHEDSGFFFGMKGNRYTYIGMPADEEGNILITGLQGSGKTMAIVIPTMYSWKGFQIIVDVKGNLYRHWKSLNGHTGKRILLFSPEMPVGCSCYYDPYASLRHGGEDNVPGNARILALSLLPLLSGSKVDPTWIQTAQNFLTGAIIYYFNEGMSFAETMIAIQTSPISEVIDEIMNDENLATNIYMSKLKDVQEKVIANIGMELSNLAALVLDPAILNVLSANENCDQLDWMDLNTATEPFDVILEFPEASLERWQPLMTLMINQLIKTLEKRPERTYKKGDEAPPILVMLDEFPRLGNIFAIKNGLSTLRSRGVRFALFIQNIAQIEEVYGSVTARVIMGICSYHVVLKVSDPPRQDYFSKLMGTVESTQRSISKNFDPYNGNPTSFSSTITETREPIIQPHEFHLHDDVIVKTDKGYFRVEKIMLNKRENIGMFYQEQIAEARRQRLAEYKECKNNQGDANDDNL